MLFVKKLKEKLEKAFPLIFYSIFPIVKFSGFFPLKSL